tara:strand:- start:578 stop:1384 length:807 start_codon:yes stop_codon:yes gene_type:complete
MDPIEDLNIIQLDIPQLDGRGWMYAPPIVPSTYVPVTIKLGFPIVDLPGCVEFNKDNKKDASKLPLDRDLVNDDEDGTTILCPNGQYPSYNPINFDAEQVIPIKPASTPIIRNTDNNQNDDEQIPLNIPNAAIPTIPNTNQEECPAPNQPRIGDVAQNQTEKVSGYELRDGICVILYEDIGVVEQYLPSAQVVTSTAGIAVVATTSALLAKPLADLLLKVVKPLVKKLIGSIKEKLGSKEKRLTLTEIQTIEYRKKKGLPPLKLKKKS